MINYIILVIMTIIGAFASFFLKKSSSSNKIAGILCSRNLYIGGGLYLFSAILNIYLLKYMAYSVVLPLTALTYVWTMIISRIKLQEIISRKKVIGVCIIMIGVLLVAR